MFRRKNQSFILQFALFSLPCLLLGLVADSNACQPQTDDIELENTQELTTPLIPADQAVKLLKLPSGFSATVFAAEPQVRQPISVTTDGSGRIWVAECITYAESERNFDTRYNDRILIFEDTDGDGEADKRTVFWDGGKRLTSIEVGHGGVYVTCAPHFMFIPDRNGDDVPDGPPEILLDGWNADFVRHNMVNGLRWGPDGWLYGRHGIQATSHIGVPGSTDSQRIALNCCIWRFHPQTREFEVVCEGTTNPWGHDWDQHGQLFMINTVIGHLWHVVPGARYRRMYGAHFNPYTYDVIEQTADHFHFSGKENWNTLKRDGMSDETDQLGGGHAHCGMMIYQGDNWPQECRGQLFTANFHGRRLNRESLHREGNGYVGKHEPDFIFTDDLWFRGIEMIYGPDGGVFLLDWSDIGECHERDGIHRTSGRIYKIVYGQPKTAKVDLRKLSTEQLFEYLNHENRWHGRTARRLLHQRAADSEQKQQINRLIENQIDTQIENNLASSQPSSTPADINLLLQTMWLKHAINYSASSTGSAEGAKPAPAAKRLDPQWTKLLEHKNEHVRCWAIRSWTDAPAESLHAQKMTRLLELASSDPSALVRLYLASSMRRMDNQQRLQMAEQLSRHSSDADDRTQPKLIWQLLEPAVVPYWRNAIKLAESSQLPHLRRCVTRRLTAEVDSRPEFLEAIIQWAVDNTDQTEEVLDAVVQTLSGRRTVAMPKNWPVAAETLQTRGPEVQKTATLLGTLFGEGASIDRLRKIARDAKQDPSVRRTAIKALGESKPEDLFRLLNGMMRDRSVAQQVVRSIANCDQPEVASSILKKLPTFDPETMRAAIDTLSRRKPWAESLLAAVKNGTINGDQLTAAHVRQIQAFEDEQLNATLAAHWGIVKETPAQQLAAIEQVTALIERQEIEPDIANGAKMFKQTCSSCHVLFGNGGKRGPDLTGSDRKNLAYLLGNIIAPSAAVADTYRSSILQMTDGRVLVGVITEETDTTLKLLMAEEERLLEIDQIENRKDTEQSLMPDGLLEKLTEQEIVDLIGYLRK